MIKFRTISLVILMIGFILSTTSCATRAPTGKRSHITVKNSRQKAGHRFKPHHRAKAHHHLKVHNKKHKGQTKHLFMRKRKV